MYTHPSLSFSFPFSCALVKLGQTLPLLYVAAWWLRAPDIAADLAAV
jgi:hypothetical protein